MIQQHGDRLIALLGALALLSGCANNQPRGLEPADRAGRAPPGDAATSARGASRSDAGPQEPGRPETKQGVIRLEGQEEPMTFYRFDSSQFSLPVRFTTYVPQDMVAEAVRTDEIPAVRFVANFAGKRNEDAYLQVGFFPPETNLEEARRQGRAIATRRGLRPRSADAPRRWPWSLAEYDFARRVTENRWQLGTVALRRHGDRFFQVILNYPEEYEEGFVPRAERILEEWRWEDGSPLDSKSSRHPS